MRHISHRQGPDTLLVPAQDGTVLLDGVDVRELRQNSLRSAIAVVPQGTCASFAQSYMLVYAAAALEYTCVHGACKLGFCGTGMHRNFRTKHDGMGPAADTVLFADTIMRNLAYGRPSATRAEIMRAAGGHSSNTTTPRFVNCTQR